MRKMHQRCVCKKVITQIQAKVALFIKIVYIIPNKLSATRKVIQMLQKTPGSETSISFNTI